MFSSGNLAYWMIATKEAIVGEDGLKTYTDEQIPIKSSYLSCKPSTGRGNNQKCTHKTIFLLKHINFKKMKV